MPIYLLIDNGSKKAQATLALRQLAVHLSEKTGKLIHPVSLQHADALDAADINNIPADTFTTFLHKQLQQGEREFIVIPLFFGKSRALTSFIPQQVSELENEFGTFEVNIADVIFPLEKGEPRLAEILYDHIQSVSQKSSIQLSDVVLVDHGSPVPAITAVREQVAKTLQSLLGNTISLGQAVMERREGAAYDFNGELLVSWLSQQAEKGVTHVIVAMLFFLPGRHAGECGDIEEICESVMTRYPELNVSITPLISEHKTLVAILEDRINEVA